MESAMSNRINLWMVAFAIVGLSNLAFCQYRKGTTQADFERLNELIQQSFGSGYVLVDILNPDSLYPGRYDLLKNRLIFAANGEDVTSLPSFVGVASGQQIVWASEKEIQGGFAGIDDVVDVNDDGRPELVVLCNRGINQGLYEVWIYSWDGTSARRMNAVLNGKSTIGQFSERGLYEFVDTNGDGTLEIRLQSADDDSILYFYWDGSEFRQGTPTPFSFLPRNKVDVEFRGSFERIDARLRFRYFVMNKSTSRQSIDDILLSPVNGLNVSGVNGRPHWRPASGPSFIRWTNLYLFGDRNFIAPGETDSTFTVEREGIVRITKYYVQGHNGDEFSGSEILTNSVSGVTVGPADPPDPFVPTAFLDTLISYKHQAFALGWIADDGIVTSLDQKLDAARPAIINDRPSAKQILQAFVLELDGLITQSGKITSEAYALLKFNAEYLISKL